ncbi:hypothetical protein IWW47_000768 [Coemansia sp. RSA 2052]|nr:hypothetical protein GGF38_000422 [Coemansia sp. RSA 25]KAJ2508134.1 hypothetical protein IWW47_000768 [Coemansia sp. RSA 2052]
MVQWFNAAGIQSVLALLRRPHLLMPHMAVSDIRAIPYDALRSSGIKYVVFDKDNCLTAPYVNEIHPEFQHAWSQCNDTFSSNNILIVSNSAGTPDDVDGMSASAVERALGVPVLRHSVKKPGCGKEILDALAKGAKPEEIAVVGDRLATDVVLANSNGMLAIWTKDIITEKGDNSVAMVLRSLEHRVYEILKSRNVQPPAHPSGISSSYL